MSQSNDVESDLTTPTLSDLLSSHSYKSVDDLNVILLHLKRAVALAKSSASSGRPTAPIMRIKDVKLMCTDDNESATAPGELSNSSHDTGSAKDALDRSEFRSSLKIILSSHAQQGQYQYEIDDTLYCPPPPVAEWLSGRSNETKSYAVYPEAWEKDIRRQLEAAYKARQSRPGDVSPTQDSEAPTLVERALDAIQSGREILSTDNLVNWLPFRGGSGGVHRGQYASAELKYDGDEELLIVNFNTDIPTTRRTQENE